MSTAVAVKAAKGFLWSVATGLGTRLIGVVGTLYLTYLIDPATMGEVSNAHAAALLAHAITGLGLTQFLIVGESKPGEADRDAGQVTLLFLGIGFVALAALTLAREPLGAYLHSPDFPRFLPGLALSMAIDRVGAVPERILARNLEFRAIGLGRTASELSYTIVSVGLARAGWGGMAVVAANVVRSVLYAFAMARPVPVARWLTVRTVDASRWGAIVRLGIPYWVNHAMILVSRRGDNLIMARAFTPEVVGLYNQGYNVADIPATQVGEQVADVLFPSFRMLEPHERPKALLEALGLLALVVFPLSVGLAAVAPSVVGTVLPARWQGVAPYLMILSAVGVVRPVGWALNAYLQSAGKGREVMLSGVSLVVALFTTMPALATFGPRAAAFAVGITFSVHAIVSAIAVRRAEGPSVRAVFGAVSGPFFACIPMFLGVRALHEVLLARGLGSVASLVVEIAAGGALYGASSLVFAREPVRRLIGVARGVLERRRGA